MAAMAIERTFSIIKPDAVAKNVIGPITAKLEAAGLRVVGAEYSLETGVVDFFDDAI